MTRSFGLNALTALRALRTAVSGLRSDSLNEDLARECSCKAWHLCDHAFKALGANSQFKNLRELQDHVRSACPEIGYLQDICVATKHGEITRFEPRIDETRYHQGDFSPDDFDSRDFDTDRLEILLRDGRTVSFDDAVNRATAYWSKFFEDHAIR